MRLSRNVATELMPYNGEIPLQFFDVERIETPPPSDALPDAPPTVTYRKIPLTEVSFPASWEQVLFIMMPADPDRRESLRIFPMRYDVAHVRPGYIRIFNTTENNLVVEVEDEHHELRAYSPVDFRPPTVGEHQVFRLNIYGRDERTGAPRLRLTTRVTSRDAKSNFYLLYPDSPRRLRLMRVGGHEPPPTPTPAPPPAA
ncbi:MAG: hypothetical protein LAT83_19470 [Kiritimatiellae bacterium]|nr:hypothetical protein [Kiritimatiellia bacterium]